MDLKFYEMHFEWTEQYKLEGGVAESSSFSLLCMTQDAKAFCAVNNKVYHLSWGNAKDELEQTLVFSPHREKGGAVDIILLDATEARRETVLAVVYFSSGKYVLCVFHLEEKTMKVRCREEEVLHSKPNLLYLAPDPLSSGGVVLFTAYYTDPTVDVFTYNVTVSRMEEAAVREHYPGVHRYTAHREKVQRGSSVLRGGEDVLEKRAAPEYLLCLDVLVEEDVQYLAYGTLEGKVYVWVTNCNGCLWNAHHDWEGPISALRLFKVKGYICLAAACTVEQVLLFTDINSVNRLSYVSVLPESTLYDSVTCLAIMDIDCDGEPEILVGTYGRMFLVYKLTISEDGRLVSHIEYRRDYSSPIFHICYSDMTGDGLQEVLLLSFNGIHVLQRCLKSAQLYIQKLLNELQLSSVKCPFADEHEISVIEPLPPDV